jgi:hypothetical protein
MTQRASGTQKRIAMLKEMGRAANMTTGQVSALTKQLNIAAAAGASTMAQLTKSSTMAQKFNLAGSGGRFGGGRSGLASGAIGTASMVGGMMGGAGSGPVSGALSMASMAASFIPGIGGLVAGPILGITSAIVGGFEAAAEAEKQKKEELRIEKLEAQIAQAAITVENEKKFGQETLVYMKAAGLSIKDAAAATRREQAEALALATKYSVSAVRDEKGEVTSTAGQVVDSMRTALIDAGFGAEFAKNTQKSNLMLEAAVKLSKSTNVTDPQALADSISQTLQTGGVGGLKKIIKEDAQIATDPLTGEQLVTTAAGASALQQKKGNIDFATAAIDPLTDQLAALKKALGTVANVNDAGGTLSTRNAANSTWFKELKDASFDFSKVQGYNPNAKAGQYFTQENLLAAVKAQLGSTSDQLYNMQQQKTTGVTGDYRGQMRTDNYTRMMMNQVVPKSTIAETTANTTAKAANTTANAATVMANAAATIANVANVAIKQPTWYIVNTGTPATNATASELLSQWVNTGVNPIPGKKP